MDWVQLEIRQRPGGGSGALRRRQLRGESSARIRRRIGLVARPADSRPACSAGEFFATPPSPTNPTGTPISPTGVCPSSQYGSKFLQIPAPGTENDDHNPPRVAARSLFDVAIGDDNLFRGDRYKWSLRLQAINITNKEAVYNFLSTFSGTHYVTPRAMTAEVGFHF